MDVKQIDLQKQRHEITKSGAGGDEDVLPEFLPFKGKYVSVRAVWRHNAPQEATRATVFSSRRHTMRDAVIPLLVPLKAATEPLQARLGQSPQQSEAPNNNNTTKLHHNGVWLRGDLNRLGCSTPKSNKIR